MNSREAKDFLIQQTAEQAALENIPLSDLERRMMYFTETAECPEDPIALNDAFEAQYDSDEYEAKILELTRHAYGRLKKENPQSARTWHEAVQQLRRGDHYLLVLLGNFPTPLSLRQFLPGWSFWKLLVIGLVVLAICLVVMAVMLHRADSVPGTQHTPWVYSSLPSWLQHTIIGLLIGSYLSFLLFLKQVGNAFNWLIANTIGRITRDSEERE
jgi:hypothetical protein